MTALISRIEPALGLGVERLPALFVSLAVAEVFFKFGSFLLECVAFLALWRALDFATQLVRGRR
jgi:hypothetical protein